MVMAMVKLRERKYTRISRRSAPIPLFKKSIGTGHSTVPTATGSAISVVSVQLTDLGASKTTLSTGEVGKKIGGIIEGECHL
jgi:hypothetical protein